jgi:hypothetical protein
LHLTECNWHNTIGGGEWKQWLHDMHTFKPVGHSSENIWKCNPHEVPQEELCTHARTHTQCCKKAQYTTKL